MSNAVQNLARSLLEDCRASLTEKSPGPLGAFFIGSNPVGHLQPAVLQALTRPSLASFVDFTEEHVRLRLDEAADTFETRSARLKAFVSALQKEALLGPLLGEYVDLLSSGVPIARIDRSAVRFLGLSTRIVRLLAICADGRWCLQKRSRTKRVAPGLFDNFAAGMVSAGETPLEAILRETREETGWIPEQSALIFSKTLSFSNLREVHEGILCDENLVFETRLPDDCSPFGLDGEVDSFVCLNDEELLELIKRRLLMPEAARTYLSRLLDCR